MALSELAALDAAYQALRPLDSAGRRRALHWLSDALAAEAPLPAKDEPVANRGAEPTPADNPRTSTAGRAARQPRRRAAAPTADTTTAAAGARTRGRRASRQAATDNAKRTKVAARQGARPYRRMPAADTVMAAYRRVGSVSALAEHFDVPVHTVQGWARQLRRHGYTIGQTR
jgi:hypothetical protein